MQTEECRRALDWLAAYLADPALHLPERDAAANHIRGCAGCQARVAQLIRAHGTNEDDELVCEECQDSLPDYLTAVTDGQAGQADWQRVTLHLALCPHCAATFAQLSHLRELAEGKRGVEPPQVPAPQLGFLASQRGAQPSPAIPWRLDELGRLIIELSGDLVRALQAATRPASFGAAGLKSNTAPVRLFQADLNEMTGDLEVSLTAEQTRRDPTRCTLLVDVRVPSRGGWPHLAGTEVTLKRDGQEVGRQATDAYGTAVFEGLAVPDLARLAVEIEPVA
jgi:hypothetical protein